MRMNKTFLFRKIIVLHPSNLKKVINTLFEQNDKLLNVTASVHVITSTH
jgi:hypothetical protein